MNREKRHAGRAIRKERRQKREALVALAQIDLGELADRLATAFAELGAVVARAAESVLSFFEQLATAYVESREQEFRMTYRALTTGHEATR